MFLLKPLKRRPIAWLWSGQLFSSIGDEVYNVALVWLAAGLIGLRAGYLSAVQALSIVLFGALGSVWADRWDLRKTLVRVDLIRGAFVLLIPLAAVAGHMNIWLLAGVAVVVSGLNSFFTPALRAMLPEVAPEQDTLQAATGLMETTTRLGRVIGPGMIAILNRVLPMIHFFTFDAVSFFVSAWSVVEMDRLEPSAVRPEEASPATSWSSLGTQVFGGHQSMLPFPLIYFSMMTGVVVNAVWMFCLPLGIGLRIHEIAPTNMGALGLVIAGYGAGNLVGLFIGGNLLIERPERFLFTGRVLAGIGFIAFALSPTLTGCMLAAAFAASGGPVADLGYLTMLQDAFRGTEYAKILRFYITASYALLFVLLVASPKLFAWSSVAAVILGCGAVILAIGLWGFARYRFHDVVRPRLPSWLASA